MAKDKRKILSQVHLQLRREIDDIADAEKQSASLNQEVAADLSKADPRDAKAIQAIATRKLQADTLPMFIQGAKAKVKEQTLPAVVEAFEAAGREYEEARQKEHETVLRRWEERLRPAAPDVTERNGEILRPAREIAAALPAMACFQSRWPSLPPQWQSESPEAVLAVVEEALALLDSVERNGGFAVAGLK